MTKPSNPIGIVYPSAENGLDDTKDFLNRIKEFDEAKQMKILEYFLKKKSNEFKKTHTSSFNKTSVSEAMILYA